MFKKDIGLLLILIELLDQSLKCRLLGSKPLLQNCIFNRDTVELYTLSKPFAYVFLPLSLQYYSDIHIIYKLFYNWEQCFRFGFMGKTKRVKQSYLRFVQEKILFFDSFQILTKCFQMKLEVYAPLSLPSPSSEAD